ncbi:MAG: hypothetical protein NTU62_08570 [Spirochaetes bacterium]|nr:hypothetical protein [Spirochaetota bacterium]
MKSRIVLPLLLMLAIPVTESTAQANLSVDIQDPVYQILDLGVLKGAIGQLSAVRPFSRSQVVGLLERLWEARDRFSLAEQSVLAETRRRFTEDRSGLAHGTFSVRPREDDDQIVQAGVDARSRFRLNAESPEDWHLDSVFRPFLRGDLVPWFSYLGILGLTLDRVRSEEAFAPYDFSKQWDALHFSIRAPRFSHGELDYPTISYVLETEMAAQLLRDSVRLSLARQRREWGIGDGSLTLGGSARPFVGIETHVQLTPWLIGHQLVGSLANWEDEPSGIGAGSGTLSYQKLFALQRLEIFPFPWLSIATYGSVIGAKRFEMTYMAPLLFGALAQNLIADLDNVGMGADLGVTIPPYGRVFLSVFADELGIARLNELFTRPRNIFALQGGLKFAVPGLPFTSLTAQYTKIEPFTYAHYPTDYPDYRIPVDTAYTHDGENLAYPLWPNSDEILVKLVSLPVPNLRASLEYRLIRHGDNPSANPGDPAILGRPDGYYDYSVPDDSYPDKDFLHDGLYDHNHIATLSGEYTIPHTPVTVGLSYTFSYTYWEPNASGELDRPDTMRNIFGIEVKVFR